MSLILQKSQIPPHLLKYFEDFDPNSELNTLNSVFTINPKPFKGSHAATFPIALIAPCIKTGTSEYGCCAECGQPYTRITEIGDANIDHQKLCGGDNSGKYDGKSTKDYLSHKAQDASATKARILAGLKERKTVGWQKMCKCETNEVNKCIVLDCFMGAGTVGLVAKQLGRDYIGLELNPEYAKMATDRIENGK